MVKNIYFSPFVSTEEIEIIPKTVNVKPLDKYRYSLTIPFEKRRRGPTAVVIMKNPSKAGFFDGDSKKLLSDDTIYRVCDYIFKRKEKFSKLVVLNLFPIYGSTFKNIAFKNIRELTGEVGGYSQNDKVIQEVINSLTNEGDRIILAWGGYPNISGNLKDDFSKSRQKLINKLYVQRIKKVLNIIKGRPVYKVGTMLTDGKFPQHGKMWYDFEELELFDHPKLSE